MNHLQIRLLGNFTIEYNDARLACLTSPRLQSAFAYLVLYCRDPQPRRHVAFQLWPDSSERQARNNLRKVLHQLRSALTDSITTPMNGTDGWFLGDAQWIQWQPALPYTVDVAEFETKLRRLSEIAPHDLVRQQRMLADAISLHQGDLLPACYDEWIAPERERLRQHLIKALEQLIQLSEERRDYPTAIHYAQQMLQQDPLHEATYRRLMRLYALADNRAGALQTYQTCLALLQQELGVEPAPETQQAHAQLLAVETPTVLAPRENRLQSDIPQFVGRQVEWQTLHTTWQQTKEEGPRFVLISGEAGIGKTHLAEELLSWAERQGIATAQTRAYAAGSGLAYAPVVEWLQRPPLQTSLAALDDLRLAEVALLLPDLLTDRPALAASVPSATGDLSQWQRQRLFDALSYLLLNDHKPKVLLIDDLQWCDSETLAWLRYLFACVHSGSQVGADATRILILGTVRPEEVDSKHPLMALILELRGTAQIAEIALAPLNEVETTELATLAAEHTTEHTIDITALATIFAQTGGNPLFVVEMVRAGLIVPPEPAQSTPWSQQVDTPLISAIPHLQADMPLLPPKMLAVIQSRLNRLSPGAHKLAAIAAVIGRAFTFTLLKAVSEVDENTLINQLEELWQRGIVRAYGSQTYDFSHDRIRDVAHAEISPVQRPRLHQQVAQALERLHVDKLDPLYARLAYHYEVAGEFERAITNYRQAADVVRRRFADADAVALLTHALSLVVHLPTPQIQKREELSLLLQLIEPMLVSKGYLAPELGEIGRRSVALAQELDYKQALFAAMAGLRGYEQMSGRYQSALKLAKKITVLADEILATNLTSSSVETDLSLKSQSGLANSFFYMGELADARTHYDQALSLQYPATGTLIFSAMNLWLLGYPDRAREQMHQALVNARDLGHPHEIGFATTNLARLNHFLRRNQLARLWAEQAITLCSSYAIPFWVKLGKLFLGRALAETGDHSQGIDLLQETLAELDADSHQAFCSYFWGLLAEAYLCTAQYEHATSALERGLSYVERNGEGFWHPELIRLHGNCLAAQGLSAREVESSYEQAIAVAQAQAGKSLELRATITLCRLWQQQGKYTAAHARLSKIYDWFTEGHRTADLQAARQLLAQLSSSV